MVSRTLGESRMILHNTSKTLNIFSLWVQASMRRDLKWQHKISKETRCLLWGSNRTTLKFWASTVVASLRSFQSEMLSASLKLFSIVFLLPRKLRLRFCDAGARNGACRSVLGDSTHPRFSPQDPTGNFPAATAKVKVGGAKTLDQWHVRVCVRQRDIKGVSAASIHDASF